MKELIERAEESLRKQTDSLQKKLDKLAKAGEYDQVDFLYARGQEHLGVLAETIFYLKNRPQSEESAPEFIPPAKLDGQMTIKEVFHTHGKEAARAVSISRAIQSQPHLFDSSESTYTQTMRLMNDGTIQPIIPVKISQ